MAFSSFLESARSNAARREASNLSIAERREERRGCQDERGWIWGERKRERRWRERDWERRVEEVEGEWVEWRDARMMWGGLLDERAAVSGLRRECARWYLALNVVRGDNEAPKLTLLNDPPQHHHPPAQNPQTHPPLK